MHRFALTAAFALTTALSAQINLPPADLNPGESYRVLFVTDSMRDATSSDLAEYDAFGSAAISESDLRPLVAAGGRARVFHPMSRPALGSTVRDHRKLLVADDVAFVGGMNLTEEYAGARLGSGRFRDTLLEVRGPVVEDLAHLFLEAFTDDDVPRQTARAATDPAGSFFRSSRVAVA